MIKLVILFVFSITIALIFNLTLLFGKMVLSILLLPFKFMTSLTILLPCLLLAPVSLVAALILVCFSILLLPFALATAAVSLRFFC